MCMYGACVACAVICHACIAIVPKLHVPSAAAQTSQPCLMQSCLCPTSVTGRDTQNSRPTLTCRVPCAPCMRAHTHTPHAGVKPSESGGTLVVDRSTNANHLALRSNAPLYVYSTAPLALSDGRPVAQPTPGAGGYSLRLHDKQVRARVCVCVCVCVCVVSLLCPQESASC